MSIVSSGYCGGDTSAELDQESGFYKNLSWELDDAGVLAISGNGVMYDFDYFYLAPWRRSTQILLDAVINHGVTSIGDSAFWGCMNLTSITIPDSVTSIGESAFYHCDSLTSVTIPEGVASIALAVFAYCSNLTSITIPDSVTSIGVSAFYYCTKIASVTMYSSIANIGAGAFDGCDSISDVYYYGTKQEFETLQQNSGPGNDDLFSATIHYVDIPTPSAICGISMVWSFAEDTGTLTISGTGDMFNFSSQRKAPWDGFAEDITSIEIRSGVNSIGSYAFNKLINATEVSLPSSLTEIGSLAFNGCSGLSGIDLPGNLSIIGIGAFYGCAGLEGVEIPGFISEISIDAFRNCSGLQSVDLPLSVSVVGQNAFYGCSAIQEVTYAGNSDQFAALESASGSGNTYLFDAPDITYLGHTFSEDWSYNDTHHWHAATDPSVTEVSDYGPHVWDAGEIIVEPTPESPGTVKFTCTVCGKTRTESVSYGINFSASNAEVFFTTDSTAYEESAVSWDLFEYGMGVLGKASFPSYHFSVDSANFLALEDFVSFRNQLEIGKKLYLRLGDERIYQPVCVGLSLDFEDPSSLKLQFSDTYSATDYAMSIADLLGDSVSVSRSVTKQSSGWSAFIDSGASSSVKDFMKSALDVTKNRLFSSSGQAISYDESGLRIRKRIGNSDADFDPCELWMTESNILMTTDGWNTAKMAIGKIGTGDDAKYGVIADNLIGSLIVGENLQIHNEANDFVVNNEGIFINAKKLYISSGIDGKAIDEYISKSVDDGVEAKIILDGLVAFTDLENHKEGVTFIDGANIKTGTVTATKLIGEQILLGASEDNPAGFLTYEHIEGQSNIPSLIFASDMDAGGIYLLSKSYDGTSPYSASAFVSLQAIDVRSQNNPAAILNLGSPYGPGSYPQVELTTFGSNTGYHYIRISDAPGQASGIHVSNPIAVDSDRDIKQCIEYDMSDFDRFFDLLHPCTYQYKSDTAGLTHVGMIAQDVLDALQNSDVGDDGIALYCEFDNTGWKVKSESKCGLRYEEFISLCIYEIQKLKKRVAELEEKLNEGKA